MNRVRIFYFKIKNHAIRRIHRKAFKFKSIRKLFAARDSSSISDNFFFPSFAKIASASNEFWNFRQSHALHEILEHVSFEDGINYIENIINLGFDYEFIRNCVKDDTIGNPNVFKYENLGTACPSTLRYANVLADLISKFGNLDNFSIIEIGGGYGGQARLIRNFFPSVDYTIIDLPEVLLLAERYLYESDYRHMFKFVSSFDFGPMKCDLVISNYAFSEIKREYQFKYLSLIISKSRMGYMIYTDSSTPEINSLSFAQVLKEIPRSVAIPESPPTGTRNTLIYWK